MTNRRNFLKTGATLGSSLLVTSAFGLTGGSETGMSGKDKKATDRKLKHRTLGKGNHSLEVSAIGLGCMSMTSNSYNPPRDKSDMVKVIRHAVERGVTLFDTAEFYGPFTSEEYIGEALRPLRNQVVIASKFGFKFENGKSTGRDARPESIRKAVEGMLRRLQTDRIDLLYLHRVDPQVSIANAGYGVGGSFKTIKELCPNSIVLDGFEMKGGVERDGVLFVMEGEKKKEADSDVMKWLKKIKQIQ